MKHMLMLSSTHVCFNVLALYQNFQWAYAAETGSLVHPKFKYNIILAFKKIIFGVVG